MIPPQSPEIIHSFNLILVAALLLYSDMTSLIDYIHILDETFFYPVRKSTIISCVMNSFYYKHQLYRYRLSRPCRKLNNELNLFVHPLIFVSCSISLS